MNLFGYMREEDMERESPLVSRLRPRVLDEMVRQQRIMGRDKLLCQAIQIDKLGFIIFHGPPGIGKTTPAKVTTNTISADFGQVNATVAGEKDTEEVVKEVKDNVDMCGWKTVLFMNKIRRSNKGQQDCPLPFVKDGTLTLIGAIMESPYFEINGVLLSRSRIFKLKPPEEDDVRELIRRAVYDKERGMGIYDAEVDEDVANLLADTVNRDVRAALNAVELGTLITTKGPDGRIHIDMAVAQECIQRRVVRYDENGDDHYDTTSALIRDMRGLDPDTAVYYLARMLYAGKDIKLIARRIMIRAAEGAGGADPQALVVAVDTAQAAECIELPEINIILSQAVTYMATTPKSNAACMAVQKVMEAARDERVMPMSVYLQGKHYKGAGKLGHGAGYRYAHDYPRHYAQQQHLSDDVEGTVFYEPSDNGYGKQINAHMKQLKSWLSDICICNT